MALFQSSAGVSDAAEPDFDLEAVARLGAGEGLAPGDAVGCPGLEAAGAAGAGDLPFVSVAAWGTALAACAVVLAGVTLAGAGLFAVGFAGAAFLVAIAGPGFRGFAADFESGFLATAAFAGVGLALACCAAVLRGAAFAFVCGLGTGFFAGGRVAERGGAFATGFLAVVTALRAAVFEAVALAGAGRTGRDGLAALPATGFAFACRRATRIPPRGGSLRRPSLVAVAIDPALPAVAHALIGSAVATLARTSRVRSRFRRKIPQMRVSKRDFRPAAPLRRPRRGRSRRGAAP